MQEADRYFAYCYFPTSNKYCILPSKFLEPRPKLKESSAGVAWATLGDEYWGATFRSAWHDRLEVFPKKAIFLDGNLKNDEDFEIVLANAKFYDCFVLATASSVEQLQLFIATCDIKIPKLKRKLPESPANLEVEKEIGVRAAETDVLSPNIDTNDEQKNPSSDLQLPEEKMIGIQDQNHESAEIKLTDLEMIKLEEILKQGESEGRPEGEAKLGYFEVELDGKITKQNATNVFVLVVHYDFKNTERFRKCDAPDVENLWTTFRQNRNCNMRELLSPNKMILLKLLSDQEMLLRFFRSTDVPDLFVLFVLSHGNENGTIFTDHKELNEFVSFTTNEVFTSLKKLTAFEKCLKLINFGPCRGTLTDESVVSDKNQCDDDNNENRNACRITFHPAIHNVVILYSTVEKILANTSKMGSYFIRKFCDCLNWITDGTPLLTFLTFVQHFIHNGPKGQSPELKMFPQDKKFVLWGLSKNDAKVDASRIITTLPGFYSWRSEKAKNIRGRRAFVLFEEQKKEVLDMENALHQNLDFETSEWRLSESNLNLYFEKVSKLEHDVGCILTCIFGQICENEGKEVCVLVDKKEKPITDILHRFVGPKNRKWIGKPKIFFLVKQKAREKGTDSLLTYSDAHISASNHSGWLVLILNDEDSLMQLIKILQGKELKQEERKSSLQELLVPLLISKTKEIKILLNSTLHCCLNFPNWPRTFIQPELKIKKDGNSPFQKIGFGELIDKVKFSSKESQKDDSSGANNRETEDSALAWLLSSVAGAGKTTVLKEIAYQLAKFDLGIKVLHVSLKKHSIYMLNMSEVEINIVQFLAETTWTDPDDMKNWVEKRKVVVFLDGFSEILSGQRDKALKIARTLKEMRIPFIIGARPNETEGILKNLENVAIVEIQPLDEEKQRELLQLVARKNEAVIEKLVTNIELKDVMGNPLYLLLLAESDCEGGIFDIFDHVVRKIMKICMERDNDDKEVTDEKVEINLDRLRLIAHHALKELDVVGQGVSDETLENMCILGFTTVSAGKVNFVYESVAKFLTAQRCLKNLVEAYSSDVLMFVESRLQSKRLSQTCKLNNNVLDS